MPRTKISEFSATPSDNTDIDGIDIAEGCAPSGINNAIRELMAQLKDMQTGTSGDAFTLTTLNSTTVDTTNLEVTNLKAKDGTAAGSIANSTGVVTLASTVLTTTDINGGTVDGTVIGGASAAAVSSTNLAYTGTLTGGTGVVNLGSGQFYKDASGNVGIDTATPAYRLQVRRAGGAGSLGVSIDSVGSAQRVAQYFAIGDSTSATTGHAFYTRNGTATDNIAAYIDASGNVGIGTSSPSTYGKLAVVSNGADTRIAVVDDTTNGRGGYLRSNFSDAVILGTTSGVRALVFAPDNQERVRIDTSGNLLVGTTATSNTNGVKITKGGAAGGGIIELMKTGSGNTNGILNYYQTTYVGGVNFDNTSTSFPTSSDIRLKKDIVDAPSATQKIDNIRIVSHGWKHDDAVVEFGVIAQELVSVAPSAVAQGDDGEEVVTTWSVDYSKLVPMLIKAHQEQQALIADLTTRLTALESS